MIRTRPASVERWISSPTKVLMSASDRNGDRKIRLAMREVFVASFMALSQSTKVSPISKTPRRALHWNP